MKFVRRLFAIVSELFQPQTLRSELERWITSRNPQTAEEVEYLTRKFYSRYI